MKLGRFFLFAFSSYLNAGQTANFPFAEQVLSAKLAKVLAVAKLRASSSAEGPCSHIQLRFHCPRVSLAFHVHPPPAASHMSSASSLAAKSSHPAVFELCMRELQACALTHMQPELKKITGSMRTAFDGSIAGLTFREVGAAQLRSGMSGFEAASSPPKPRFGAVAPWLVMSPAAGGNAEHGVC